MGETLGESAAQATGTTDAWPARWARVEAFLNGPRHRLALTLFLLLAVAHMLEHVVQMAQIHLLGMPLPRSKGLLGMLWPALVDSEWLHFGYALLTFVGLVLLRPAFRGAARWAWNVALLLQVWHYFEHVLLLTQAALGVDRPTSVLQFFFRRPELHMTYNVLVFVPLVLGALLHLAARRRADAPCGCGRASAASGPAR